MRSIVAFYEIDRLFGGPEEGGWSYDAGRFVRAVGFYMNEEAALKTMRRANRLLERLQRHRRSVESILYDGGRYRALCFNGLPPKSFPETRPQYE